MRAPRRRLSILVALVLWGLMTHSTYVGQGDEPHYLAIAHSIAFDRDINLSNNFGQSEPLIGGGGLDPGNHARPGVGGIVRPVHDVGMPLLFSPYVAVAAPIAYRMTPYADHQLMRRFRLTPTIFYRHLLSMGMIGVAVLLSVLMFTVFTDVGLPGRIAFWTALLVSLSPPLMIFALVFFTEMISALLALVVFRRVALRPDAGAAPWLLAGIATGLLVLIHVKNVGIAIPLAVLATATLLRRRLAVQLMSFSAGLAALLLLRTWITHRFWGSLVTTPHARQGDFEGWSELASTAFTRLAGLLVDQEFGLLPYAPVFLLAILGAFVQKPVDRAMMAKLAFVVGCHLLLIVLPLTNVHGWTGGWSPAARFLTPIVPLLAIPVAHAVASGPRLVVAGAVAAQIVVSGYMWQNPKNLWNDADGVAAVCERGGATFCGYLPSIPDR